MKKFKLLVGIADNVELIVEAETEEEACRIVLEAMPSTEIACQGSPAVEIQECEEVES